MWIAQSPTGIWYSYKDEPRAGMIGWLGQPYAKLNKDPFRLHWSSTLQYVPDQEYAMRFKYLEEIIQPFTLRVSNKSWPDFGDYAVVEMERLGGKNEFFYHKVIGVLESDTYVDVPIRTPVKEATHGHYTKVARVVCCGVSENTVYCVPIKDLHKVEVIRND